MRFMKINNLNRIALGINAADGINVISLGFKLMKKPNKTSEEEIAAKAFIKSFRWTVVLVLLSCAVLAVMTGFAMSATEMEYKGGYAESRTGRMEDGQIRYVKNELYYINPEEYGLSSNLPDNTHITVYFNENDDVVACINADEVNGIREQRMILMAVSLVFCIVVLLAFAVIARTTFGKPWYQWVNSIRGI